jgi:hypothetical protein
MMPSTTASSGSDRFRVSGGGSCCRIILMVAHSSTKGTRMIVITRLLRWRAAPDSNDAFLMRLAQTI